ncbi:MAG: SMP-30/gluconolactonase/LRE family protein [Burkholderiales bacterium]|nr:SMP-30/gluconolactonase/LRE family protein [Burkholderiales bacterium]
MWSIRGTAPEVVRTRVLTRMPKQFRKPGPTAWANANKAGQEIDSFLEGPCFDRAGNLYVVDIPFGRIFRITPALEWSLVVQYDGWPNGLAIHKDGRIWIADYRKGLLTLDPASGRIEEILGHRNSESFRGLNDLTFDGDGNCYFTDQGQTGLHDPTGRVLRLRANGQLDVIMSTIPSPNGIAVDAHARALYVAVTRANQIWRGPLQRDGSISKVAAFQTFFGASGPDGLALDVDNRLVMAHGSLGGAFVMAASGEVTHFVESTEGAMVTNVAYRPGTGKLMITESQSGSILEADLPAQGLALYSHL